MFRTCVIRVWEIRLWMFRTWEHKLLSFWTSWLVRASEPKSLLRTWELELQTSLLTIQFFFLSTCLVPCLRASNARLHCPNVIFKFKIMFGFHIKKWFSWVNVILLEAAFLSFCVSQNQFYNKLTWFTSFTPLNITVVCISSLIHVSGVVFSMLQYCSC
jgi:hypothetical protein